MKIKVSDLKDFFKKSNKIKSNGVLPIYDYLLFECDKDTVSITKSNGNMYCQHTVEEDNSETERLLVEEKRLSALVNNAKGEFIYFTVKGKKVVIKDAANEIKLEAVGDVNLNAFPTFPGSEGAERVSLNPDVISALFEARNFTSIVESNMHFVYTHKKEKNFVVFATNMHILYMRKFNEELPEMALSPEVCSIICQFQHLEYYTAGNYDFFNTGSTVYGFIKTDYKAPEYLPIIKSIDPGQTIKINREELLSFCKLVNSLAVSKFPVLRFDDAEEALLVHYDEDEYSMNTEKNMPVEKTFWPTPFALNNAYLTQILECFPTFEVVLSASANQKIFGVTHPEEEGLTIAICPVLY